MPKVSIIVIAYNAEQYLTQALDSAVRQSLQDIEIIIVDDCATDRTAEICLWYQKQDKRIRVFHNEENMGTLFSRNKAIQQVSGKYTMFLDADDYLEINACEVLSAEMDRNNWDVYGFSAEIFGEADWGKEELISMQNELSRKNQMQLPHRRGILCPLIVSGTVDWNLWDKIYRSEILKKALNQYDGQRIQMGEDLLIISLLSCYAESYASTEDVFYHYRIGSGMSTTYNNDTILPSQVENYAEFGAIYGILQEWLSNIGLEEVFCSKLLQYVHYNIINDSIYRLCYKIPDNLKKKFLTTLLKYVNLKSFVLAYASSTDIKKTMSECDAVALLASALPQVPQSKIENIAMYYHRLYNGGVERVISLLCPILQKAGYHVIVLTDEGPTPDDYSLPEGVPHIKVKIHSDLAASQIIEWQNLIQALSIDAIIYHDWDSPNMTADSLAIKSMQIPLIVHCHSSLQYKFKAPISGKTSQFAQAKQFALADLVVTLSEVDLAWCRAIGIRSIQVPNPITYNPLKADAAALDSMNALWVGRLDPGKQFYEAFEIAKLVHKEIQNFKLCVVGKTENQQQQRNIEQYLQENDMMEYILLEGFTQNIAPHYQNASIYLLTSLYEGFSMSLQEAKCFGLPVISYEIPNQTLLRQNDSGVYVVPQGDRFAAAKIIITLLSNEKLRKEQGQKARNSVIKFYGDSLENTWKNIIESSQQPKESVSPLYLTDPMHTAVRMTMQNLEEWAKNLNKMQEQLSAYQKEIAVYRQPVVKMYQVFFFVCRPLKKVKTAISRYLIGKDEKDCDSGC